MKQSMTLLKQMTALFLAASICLVQAGCSCGNGEQGGTTSGAGSESTQEVSTSSTEGVNQNTSPANGSSSAAESGNGENGSTGDMTQSAGAVGGGTVEAASYVPGTYTGTAQGYAGPIDVTVEVDESNILSVTAVGDSETDGIGKVALEKLPPEIVEKNSTQIDVMAGATYSSKGLLQAVEDALAEAMDNR